ncbi:MAG: response regulator [Acidobacteria bacterium]|nr:response regulator [Acidobacteriota bacterium]
MPFAWTECQSCRSKRRSYFTQDELNQLDRGTLLFRMCAFCRVPTQWAGVKPPGPPPEAPLPATALKPSGPVVLLIDDDEDTLAVLRRVLVSKQFNVEAADSARGALAKMVTEHFDAVVSDIHMPGFDGTKLFLFIVEYMPEYRHRVMFLTGDTESAEVQDFLRRSGCPYAYKPIDFEQLLGKISELVAAGPPSPRS